MSAHVPDMSPPAGHFVEGRFYFPVRVYYEDTDFSGSVYHATYLRFMERGRTEFLRACDIHQRDLMAADADQGFGFVVRHMDVDFRKPAVMDDALTIETFMAELGGASMMLEQNVWRKNEILVAAQVRIACVAGGKAVRLPPQIRLKLTK